MSIYIFTALLNPSPNSSLVFGINLDSFTRYECRPERESGNRSDVLNCFLGIKTEGCFSIARIKLIGSSYHFLNNIELYAELSPPQLPTISRVFLLYISQDPAPSSPQKSSAAAPIAHYSPSPLFLASPPPEPPQLPVLTPHWPNPATTAY